MFHPSLHAADAIAEARVDLHRHAEAAWRLRHLHRLFQAAAGVLACQHPVVIRELGAPVAWSGLFTRDEGGLLLEGTRGSVAIVPTMDGAWCVGRDAPEVARAVDEVLDAIFRTAENALPAARPGREGNAIARGIFYMQRALPERDFVHQYLALAYAKHPPKPMRGLFGDGVRD